MFIITHMNLSTSHKRWDVFRLLIEFRADFFSFSVPSWKYQFESHKTSDRPHKTCDFKSPAGSMQNVCFNDWVGECFNNIFRPVPIWTTFFYFSDNNVIKLIPWLFPDIVKQALPTVTSYQNCPEHHSFFPILTYCAKQTLKYLEN